MNRSAVGSERITHGFKPMPRSRDAAVYTEEQWDRKVSDERKMQEELTESLLTSQGDGVGYLIRKEIADLIEIAGLTPVETRICWAAVDGASYGELAREHRITHGLVRIKMKRIRRKMRRAAASYPFTGLWEVYQQATSRF